MNQFRLHLIAQPENQIFEALEKVVFWLRSSFRHFSLLVVKDLHPYYPGRSPSTKVVSCAVPRSLAHTTN